MDPPNTNFYFFSDVKHGVPAGSTRGARNPTKTGDSGTPIISVYPCISLPCEQSSIYRHGYRGWGRVMEISYVHPILESYCCTSRLFVKRIAPDAVIDHLLCSSSLG